MVVDVYHLLVRRENENLIASVIVRCRVECLSYSLRSSSLVLLPRLPPPLASASPLSDTSNPSLRLRLTGRQCLPYYRSIGDPTSQRVQIAEGEGRDSTTSELTRSSILCGWVKGMSGGC